MFSRPLFIIIIDGEKLRENPYNTQLWLKATNSSSTDIHTPSNGILNVHLYSEWGLICFERFTKTAADAACLQKGFTNALEVTSSLVSS